MRFATTAEGAWTMNEPNSAGTLEEQIAQWRTYVCRRPDLAAGELERLEDQLRREVAGLIRAGLTTEEAFLVAVKRLGRGDAPSGKT